MEEKHPIVFCGAGPGDPELITVKGQKALALADLVLWAGSLVPEAVLAWAPAAARRVSSADMDLEGIVALMAQGYHAGQRVVRLHTGDPSLYGAIHEQMAALRGQAIPFWIVPGVTAAFAAAAALGIEYTLPGKTQTLIFTRMGGRTPVPVKESLAALARHNASLVIYLSISMAAEAASILSEAYGPAAPCAIAHRVSHPGECIVRTRVADLVQTVRQHGIQRLAVILVGPALEDGTALAALRSKLYDRRFPHGWRTP